MSNIEKYKQIMLCIKHRIHHIQTMKGRHADLATTEGRKEIYTYWDIELEEKALQIRKSMELIVTASLITNETIYKDIYRQTNTKNPDIHKILKEIEKLHPRFYPEPFKDHNSPILHLPTPKGTYEPMRRRNRLDESDEYLRYKTSPATRDQDFGKIWGQCSEVIHSNPFDGTEYKTVAKYKNEIIRWTNLIINLLDRHSIRLLDEPTEYLFNLYFDKIKENLNKMTVRKMEINEIT